MPSGIAIGMGEKQVPPLRCASVGMTNLLEGRAEKAPALRVHSILDLPPGKSATRDDKGRVTVVLKNS